MFMFTTLILPLYNYRQPGGALSIDIPIAISKDLVELSTQLDFKFTLSTILLLSICT